MVCDGPGHECHILPLELFACPTCGGGIHPARGWTWINPSILFKDHVCPTCQTKDSYCQFTVETRAGLIWVGEKYYPTPESYAKEAMRMGISRRITCVPRGFELGQTWILLAHRKCDIKGEKRPGIFTAFKPSRIERIVKPGTNEEEIKKLEAAGFTPVIVERLGETQKLFQEE